MKANANKPNHMVFTAFDESSYRCGNYAVHWTIMGYEAWVMQKDRQQCFGRRLTISEAIAICEADAVRQQA